MAFSRDLHLQKHYARKKHLDKVAVLKGTNNKVISKEEMEKKESIVGFDKEITNFKLCLYCHIVIETGEISFNISRSLI